MDLIGRDQSGEVEVPGEPQRGDFGVELLPHRAVADDQQMGVGELRDHLRRRRDDILIPLLVEEPGDGDDHPRLRRDAERFTQRRFRLCSGEECGIHAGIDHTVMVARRDARFDALIDHRLCDGEDAVAAAGGQPFSELVEPVLPRLLVGVERLPVDGVDHHRHSGGAGGQTPDDPGLGAVGVDHVEPTVPEETFEREVRLDVVDRVDIAHQRRNFDGFELRAVDMGEQFTLPPG